MGILTEADFKSLYVQVTSGLTDAQLALMNAQVTGTGTSVTNPNVKLLKKWYTDSSQSNKIFANKLIAASVSATTTATTAASSATTSATCPITTYAAFGHLYSQETQGKTWAAINKIDSWVRGALPAVGAPLSVRKLRDCYKNTPSHTERKDFTDNAVAHVKAGAER